MCINHINIIKGCPKLGLYSLIKYDRKKAPSPDKVRYIFPEVHPFDKSSLYF